MRNSPESRRIGPMTLREASDFVSGVLHGTRPQRINETPAFAEHFQFKLRIGDRWFRIALSDLPKEEQR